MLYRNGENLKSGLIDYLNNKKKITIFSPYIKSSILLKLLATPNLNCDQIIVRWEPKDIALGSSDLGIYQICKDRGISLYMNHRIHLKLFTNNFEDAFLGSANISERAISDHSNEFNYEICVYIKSINRDDRIYLNKIIKESILITDEIYQVIENQVPIINSEMDNLLFKIPNNLNFISEFLITKLPMVSSPLLLWELYSGKKLIENQEQENCLCHDLALYNINTKIDNQESFIKILAENFFKMKFIINFLEEINTAKYTNRSGEIRDGLNFGQVRIWFAKNTTTAPSPRPFELTQNIQILYEWIEYLSFGKYRVTIPGHHSQVIKLNIL